MIQGRKTEEGRKSRAVIQSRPQGPESKISSVNVVSPFSRHFVKIDYAFFVFEVLSFLYSR